MKTITSRKGIYRITQTIKDNSILDVYENNEKIGFIMMGDIAALTKRVMIKLDKMIKRKGLSNE